VFPVVGFGWLDHKLRKIAKNKNNNADLSAAQTNALTAGDCKYGTCVAEGASEIPFTLCMLLKRPERKQLRATTSCPLKPLIGAVEHPFCLMMSCTVWPWAATKN